MTCAVEIDAASATMTDWMTVSGAAGASASLRRRIDVAEARSGDAVRRRPAPAWSTASRSLDGGGAARAGSLLAEPSAGHRLAELVHASDHALGLALLAKDPVAPCAAWHRFSRMIERIVRRIAGPGGDAEDLIQDVSVRFLQQLSTLRDPMALRAFVVVIAVRTAQYHVRQARLFNGRVRRGDDQLLEGIRDRVDVESQHAWSRFGHVLSRVRERDRVVFILRHIEGMHVRDIARFLDTSVSTVRRRLARARERVRFFAERDPFLAEYTCLPRRRARRRPPIEARTEGVH